jgi:hypothetical protein
VCRNTRTQIPLLFLLLPLLLMMMMMMQSTQWRTFYLNLTLTSSTLSTAITTLCRARTAH